jgi:hypothetical protein
MDKNNLCDEICAMLKDKGNIQDNAQFLKSIASKVLSHFDAEQTDPKIYSVFKNLSLGNRMVMRGMEKEDGWIREFGQDTFANCNAWMNDNREPIEEDDYYILKNKKSGVLLISKSINSSPGFVFVYGPDSLYNCKVLIEQHNDKNYRAFKKVEKKEDDLNSENSDNSELIVIQGVEEIADWQSTFGPDSLEKCLEWIKENVGDDACVSILSAS